MKRILQKSIVTSLCLLLLLAVQAPGQDSLIQIGKIEIQPGLLTTKLVLQTNARLPIHSSFYAPQQPRTLVIDVDQAKTAEVPLVPAAGSQVIEDIRVEKAGAAGLRFSVRLKDKVPYRILSRNDQTVVELNGIQRSQGGYVIDSETRSLLDKGNHNEVLLDALDISEKSDRASFRAKPG